MKKVLILTLLLCPVMLSAQPQIPPPQSLYHYQRAGLYELLPAGKKDILFVGNSITNGCEWAELFNNKHVKNRGINADKTYDILDMLDLLLKGKPKKIFLMIGANDLAYGIPVQTVFENIEKIADTIAEISPNTKLYIQSILPVNEKISGHTGGHFSKGLEILEVNRMLKQMCAEKSLTYLDIWSAMADDDGRLKAEYTNDGLHLLGSGYLAWKKVIRDHVK